MPGTGAGGRAHFDPRSAPPLLTVDADGDGTFEENLAPAITIVEEVAPTLIAAVQDVDLNVGRPPSRCLTPDNPYENYAAVVGVLAAAFYNPVFTSAVREPRDFAIAVLTFVALTSWKIPPWILVIALGGVGAILV